MDQTHRQYTVEGKAPNHNKRVAQIVDKIVSLIQPDEIILVGYISTVSQRGSLSSDTSDAFELITHFNLIVVCSKSNSQHELQDVIENNCKAITPITALVLQSVFYRELVLHNRSALNNVLHSAKSLYKSEDIYFEEFPQKANTRNPDRGIAEGYKIAKAFLASAELHLLRNEATLAAFMLHQAIEQFCLARILQELGLNPKTHNLDKLYRLFNFFSFDLARTFPRDNEIEQKLFQQIKDSYTAARYSSDYSINPSYVEVAIERLRWLLAC